MNDAYKEISATLQTYFDGLYEGDIQKLGSVFHPDCHLFSGTGTYLNWSREQWFDVIKDRDTPASQNLSRHDRIISIDMSDDETALAKLQCAIPPRYFTDHLSLLKLDGKWVIVSKTFRMETHD